MDKTKIKYLVGIYAAAMCIMGMLVPVPIVASVAAAFPNENIAAVQMIIGIIPLMMALSAMLVSSQLASRVSKKKTTLVGHIIVMLAGASVLVFHDSLGQVLAASAVMGLGLGAVQNSTGRSYRGLLWRKAALVCHGYLLHFCCTGRHYLDDGFRHLGFCRVVPQLCGVLHHDHFHRDRGCLPS